MKNHELLDLIGEVNEDYVLESGNNVVKPRFGWRKLAACAACAALMLGAYPVYQALNPPLHDYTVEQGGSLTTQGDIKAPAGGSGSEPAPMPGGAYVGDDKGSDMDGVGYDVPGQEAPVQEKAAAQYDALMKNGGVNPDAPNPDWYGGAWIDNSYSPEAKLAVAIVDGFRTPELEAQIEEWCGGEVVFRDVKYALAYLYELQDTVVDALTGGSDGLSCGIGVDVTENCLGVDIYSNGEDIPKEVLVKLAQLDPRGDAIRVRLFTGKLDTLTDEVVKGPAPDRGDEPDAYAPNPGAVEDAEQENTQPAREPNAVGELPQAKYDIEGE